jgi:hypothetical protein
MILRPAKMPMARKTRKPTTAMKNSSLAMPAAAPAMPPKPSAPATMATMAKIRAHLSIGSLLGCPTCAISRKNAPSRRGVPFGAIPCFSGRDA